MDSQNGKTVFRWDSEVRDYELDIQGIVNNANYLHYFDYVRVIHLKSLGLDWIEWHNKGHDFVLYHSDVTFLSPLTGGQQFYVTSSFSKQGRLRIVFEQQLYIKPDDKLAAKAINTVVCVTRNSGKPAMPEELAHLLMLN